MSQGMDDARFRETTADLLGLLACVAMAAFEERARDVSLAGSLADKAALAEAAVAEFGRFQRLRERLGALGADPEEAARPFAAAAEGYRERTVPKDVLESLVKIHVGGGLAADLFRQVTAELDPETAKVVEETLAGDGGSGLAVDLVSAATGSDRRTADRLSLWARRVAGEVLGRTLAMVAVRPGTATLIAGPESVAERSAENGVHTVAGEAHPRAAGRSTVMRAFSRSATRHNQRIRELGLTP